MWNNKLKAVTFSFDDGILQDKRLIALLDKYNLKATFNLNSARFGEEEFLYNSEGKIAHHKVNREEVKELYKNHEIAAHTLTHPFLPDLDDHDVIYQCETDRLALEILTNKQVVGFAYPGGGINNNDHIADLLKNNTHIKYARTITSTNSFDFRQDNLYRFNPTCWFLAANTMELAQKFIDMNTDKPILLYIWGHSYEGDYQNGKNWEKIESLFKLIANHDDIFYATNREVFGI